MPASCLMTRGPSPSHSPLRQSTPLIPKGQGAKGLFCIYFLLNRGCRP